MPVFELPSSNHSNCGIYSISFQGSDMVYYGSSLNMKRRLARHRGELKSGKHCNSILQRCWNKYGAESMQFTILLNCHPDVRFQVEQSFIDSHPKKTCSNLALIARGGKNSPFGIDDKQVVEIFRLRAEENKTLKEISEICGCHLSTIAKIHSRVNFSWVSIPEEYLKKSKGRKGVKLSEEEVVFIFKFRVSGRNPVELSKLFDIGAGNIDKLIKRTIYKHIHIDSELVREAQSVAISNKVMGV